VPGFLGEPRAAVQLAVSSGQRARQSKRRGQFRGVLRTQDAATAGRGGRPSSDGDLDLPRVPKTAQDISTDRDVSTTGRRSDSFRLFSGTPYEKSGPRPDHFDRALPRSQICAPSRVLAEIPLLEAHVSQHHVQYVAANALLAQARLLVDEFRFRLGTSDDDGGTFGHADYIAFDIQTCNRFRSPLLCPRSHLIQERTGVGRLNLAGAETLRPLPCGGSMSAAKTSFAPKVHYHIRWSPSSVLDWEAFETSEDAVAAANQLVAPNETYTVEPAPEDCESCRRELDKVLSRRKPPQETPSSQRP